MYNLILSTAPEYWMVGLHRMDHDSSFGEGGHGTIVQQFSVSESSCSTTTSKSNVGSGCDQSSRMFSGGRATSRSSSNNFATQGCHQPEVDSSLGHLGRGIHESGFGLYYCTVEKD
jgi:hypothetical protein